MTKHVKYLWTPLGHQKSFDFKIIRRGLCASGLVEVWSYPSSKSIPLLLQSLGRGIDPLPNPSPPPRLAGLLAAPTPSPPAGGSLGHPRADPSNLLFGSKYLQERSKRLPRGLLRASASKMRFESHFGPTFGSKKKPGT